MRFLGSRQSIASILALIAVLRFCCAIATHAQDRAASNPSADLPDAIQPQFSDQPSGQLTFDDRLKLYLHSTTNVEALLGPPFGAAIGQWDDQPPEWRQGAAGYARRVGSGYGRMFISQTIRFGVAAADKEDPRFEPSNETGFWRRTKHAIVWNFVSHTTNGARIPAVSRIAGPYSAAFISNTWYPGRQADSAHALERGTSAFGSGIGWSVIREFWPDLRRKLPFRR